MTTMSLSDGTAIRYEILGDGPAIALTPGGRTGMASLRPLAESVAAAGYRALIYDRRNCGASDTVIERRWSADGVELSEQEIWVEDLYKLLGQLGLRPCWVGGISAGCRVSLLLAIRHPDAVRGLVLWMVTGGAEAAERLRRLYYEQFVDLAEREGMDAVLNTPFFRDRMQQNPASRARLEKLRAEEFASIMRDWSAFFTADKPVLGASEEELRRITVPTLIIAGNDDVHPNRVAERLHTLVPQSELHPSPWTVEERNRLIGPEGVSGAATDANRFWFQQPETYNQSTAEKIGPLLLDFLNRHRHEAVAAR